ncbi:MAG TPA: ketose-bisphosphate aldolase [Candidatus Pullichristensenella excrementigallinarum]|uniref:Ketose-bisphosphate aldolase n=1 Tax=Candidatus Pullichristensenella excrementigallinarum TaxID=2840907 RepID=A0A9D1IEC0_9FIRM|nr:ketose-bisphosphate aldolase [Candidatus Pullichristensenella excrementigallinarum]
MLMTMKDLLVPASEQGFAIPAFNISSWQFLKGIVECCEEKKAPVIIAIHPNELSFQGDEIVDACKAFANRSHVPMAIHLDHGGNMQQILRALRAGFTSVMIDASSKPFEENIAITKQVVEIAHSMGVTVEAELGTIGTADNNNEGGANQIIYTNPEDAEKFIAATGIDALAVAIGTSHGIYPKGFEPHLRFDILQEIKKRVNIPLVLHGGSANPDEEIAQSVKLGINKINISSDIKDAFYQRLRITLEDKKVREPNELYPASIEAMKKVACHKIDLFDAADKMKYYKL